jgi:hypothetical protein
MSLFVYLDFTFLNGSAFFANDISSCGRTQMVKLSQDCLEAARDHLLRASAEMAQASAALDAACVHAKGDAQGRLALMAEVVGTQKDLAAGLAVLARAVPEESFDLLMASIAFSRADVARGSH